MKRLQYRFCYYIEHRLSRLLILLTAIFYLSALASCSTILARLMLDWRKENTLYKINWIFKLWTSLGKYALTVICLWSASWSWSNFNFSCPHLSIVDKSVSRDSLVIGWLSSSASAASFYPPRGCIWCSRNEGRTLRNHTPSSELWKSSGYGREFPSMFFPRFVAFVLTLQQAAN